MPLTKVKVELKLIGPILTKSSAPGAYGVDSVCAKDAANRYIIPWTLIKGRIRDAWRELHQINATLFPDPEPILGPEADKGGNRTNTGGSFERHNTLLFGSDFVLDASTDPERLKDGAQRTRIALDNDRHAAQEDMLQVMESPFIAGEHYTFAGTIEFPAATPAEIDEFKRLMVKSLRWAGAFGSQTGVGFGQLAGVGWHPEPAAAILSTPSPAGHNLWVRFTTTQPLCITGERVAENLFESVSTIPGGVIKGAVAAQLMRGQGSASSLVNPEDPGASDLARVFDRIRFSHSRPHVATATTRPAVIPLSLARVGDLTIDMATEPDPLRNLTNAIAFQPDWKKADWSAVEPGFDWPPRIKKELRVRTAIDPGTRRAKEHSLFAYETINPAGLAWDCEIVFPADAGELASARQQLLDLLAEDLHGVGKTKATLKTQIVDTPLPLARGSSANAANGQYVLTLQTPALLVEPAALQSRDTETLLSAYRSVFSALSGNSLELTCFFAQQSLYGGLYLYKRFQANETYQPWALTDAGSVFVFKVVHADNAAKKIGDWLLTGLPLPQWAETSFARNQRDGAHWSNNPFVPENGYGEIAVNLDTNLNANPGGAVHA